MKIVLFLQTKILEFNLPSQISGSYSFDEDIDEESKLINIEERDGKWIIYSTSDVQIMSNNMVMPNCLLVSNTFYVLKREGINYLVYAKDPSKEALISYNYNNDINLIIGNDNFCNVLYKCNFLNNKSFRIFVKDNQLAIQNDSNQLIYLNNVLLRGNLNYIKNGDQINIYGLKIIFLPDFLIINNPGNLVSINVNTAKLTRKILRADENYEDREIKDSNLYNKDDYFFKPPRIRRSIETKTIKIDAPPKNSNAQEMPFLLTVGPMLAMGITSGVTMLNAIIKIKKGETTMAQQWTTFVTGGAMLLTTLLWPIITKMYTKRRNKRRRAEAVKKYSKYLDKKKNELENELNLQKAILLENLISVDECVNIIKNRSINFWDKRIEQSDFLVANVGIGNTLLDVKVEYPEEGFTIDEDELREKTDETIDKYKYIKDVPIGYSFYENKLTAVMGESTLTHEFLNNIILQFITFYSYNELKLIIFTNESKKNNWEYLKYLNHNFDNSRNIRFFSTNQENVKNLSEYLNFEISSRIQNMSDSKLTQYKPYYLMIIDDYDSVKKFDFIKTLTELDANIGFSIIVAEDRLSKIPSKCDNFISLGAKKSGILKNSFEKQECVDFSNYINTSIDMNDIVKVLSNIPIEFEEGNKQLPDSITFLEMEKIGKVEQLNILNRWNTNNSTVSLKAEIGIDETGDLMYLDLHEKKHGPHGLIAGMTGSGKSEFIITYILAMAVNYSPDDVAFILIDYKGGGLAFAFENKATGLSLPHLAGTITNLDKAEMDRTLVSIDSEIKRRQKIFNDARDRLGKSTIDIYKYQQYYKEGKLDEPVPHLFIICDEFAELKSQQPDFMDNLISVARIGRSLGVHLILATQKPSGVVNDQIWSNSKFRVCLKVQDASDSNEMLKRPDAASLKQTGRFYLQVGYDEYFALGQSGWCGAKYYPSDKIIRQVDKSINFIDNTGTFIKNIQAGNNIKIEAKGEQLSSILQNIIEVANETNKKAKRLWLENIDPIIFVDNLIQKYKMNDQPFEINAVVGEYDAPEKQEQGLLTFSFNKNGNTIIYGSDGMEREMLLNSIIYSTVTRHYVQELNYYIIDYGSESLRKFEKIPHVGGIVYSEETEKFKNLLKYVKTELESRKKLFADYGGEYNNYIKQSNQKKPIITIIINNYDSLSEADPTATDIISSITRDCQRYGIIFIISCNGVGSISRRISQNIETQFVLHLNDTSDYFNIFNIRSKIVPRNIPGRGIACDESVHEFQTSSIYDATSLNNYINNVAIKLKEINQIEAPRIPSLPEFVTFDLIKNKLSDLKNMPIGISRNELEIVTYDFSSSLSTLITSNKINSINVFLKSLLYEMTKINNLNTIFIDGLKELPQVKEIVGNYFDEDLDTVFKNTIEFIKQNKQSGTQNNIMILLYGIEKIKSKLTDNNLLNNLITELKSSENINLIICESSKAIKSLEFDSWYSPIKNSSDGIWIGSGLSEQTVFRLGKITKEMGERYKNNFGYCIKESSGELIKLIDFYGNRGNDNNE